MYRLLKRNITVLQKKKNIPFVINGTTFDHRSIYLDMQATTPVDLRVVDKMLPYLTEHFGNAHSRTHLYGWETEQAVEDARTHVSNLIGASPKEVIFTSGATESNNIALKGIAKFYYSNSASKVKNHIITTQTEHKCILDSCRWLQQQGFEITYLPVENDGLVSLQKLDEAIKPSTILVSIMAVNNEIGVIQPLEDIGKLCRKKGVFFHTDAAQALGKIKLDVNKMNIDAMSMSGHKIYGPKGIGGLFIRKKPRIRLVPFISGGGQEPHRSGTLNTPGIIGFGEAARLAYEEMDNDHQYIQHLSTKLYTYLNTHLEQIFLNGSVTNRYPGNLNISFSCVEGEALIMALKDIAVSSGSACTSASLEPSYVLRALGVQEDLAHTSLRFGIGKFTTEEEISVASKLIVEKVNMLREMSPLWDMYKEGIDLSSIKWTE
jgi:cysteine desulfurase